MIGYVLVGGVCFLVGSVLGLHNVIKAGHHCERHECYAMVGEEHDMCANHRGGSNKLETGERTRNYEDGYIPRRIKHRGERRSGRYTRAQDAAKESDFESSGHETYRI